jgi:hypothetical protein
MRARLTITTCFLVVLCWEAPTLAQTQNRFDITLEGPWILFQDAKFPLDGSGTKTVPVVIAIVPGVADDNDDEAFHTLALSTGDGYLLRKPNAYCIIFDNLCAQNVAPSGKTSLDPDGYPKTLPLPVNAAYGWWATYQKGKNVTALILPMPDSYSNDGVYHMRFGPKYDLNATGYTDQERSIAVQLHYSKGPSQFSLRSCTSPTAAGCNVKPVPDIDHTNLNNTGTLRIVMKAPDNDSYCDVHVRAAYPEMIKLLGLGKNPTIAVIDPARSIDSSGKPSYPTGSDDCLFDDPQQYATAVRHSTEHKMSGEDLSLSQQFSAIVGLLNSLQLPSDEKKKLPLAALNAALLDPLDPDFPRISQLLRIRQLLRRSARVIDAISAKLTAQLTAQVYDEFLSQLSVKVDVQPTKEDADLLRQLDDLRKVRESMDIFDRGKSGADCRAPIMLVQ